MRTTHRGVEKLRTFDVLVDADDDRKAVKAGWSWPAFLFGSIWALFSGLWGIGIVMLPIEFILALLVNAIDRAMHGREQLYDNETTAVILLVMSIPLVIRISFGIFGNGWKRKKLTKAGYWPDAAVQAASGRDAILSYSRDREPLNSGRRAFGNATPQSSASASHKADRPGPAVVDPDGNQSQPADMFMLLLSLIIGMAVCMAAAMGTNTVVGFLPVLILLFGLIASIKTGHLGHIRIATKFISIIGWIFLSASVILGMFMQFIAFQIPPDGWTDQSNFIVSIPILGMDYIRPDQVLRNRNQFAALCIFFLLGITALRFLWLAPLERQFDSIRAFLRALRFPDLPSRPKQQSIVSRDALHPFSVADELAKWKALHDQGIISDEEYGEARRRLLNP